MCGRFTYKLTWPDIVKLYRLTLDQPARNTQPRYNVCPTDPIDVVTSEEGRPPYMRISSRRPLRSPPLSCSKN